MNIVQNKKNGILAIALIALLIATALLGSCTKKAQKAEESSVPAPEPIKTYAFPLTGEETTDQSLTQRRPLIAKIENGRTGGVRPQNGVSFADVVYETVTEGGITRLDCIYQSNIPEEVGPIRSSRNLDVTLVPQYSGLLFDSGASPPTVKELAAAPLDRLEHGSVGAALYRRVDFKRAPHDLYVNLSKAHEYAAEKRELETIYEDYVGLSFGAIKSAATDVISISVPVSPGQQNDWTYDSVTKSYFLNEDGVAFTDSSNQDLQISVSNVIVMWITYVRGNSVNSLGTNEPGANMNSGGDVSIFREGKRIDGTWATDGKTPPKFYDVDGVEIKLAKGKTWIMCPNVGTAISVGVPEPPAATEAE